MSSFALWFGASTNVTENYWADVHFNLWNLHYKQACPPCLDIGIKIYAPQGYSKVFFYVPFTISKEDICDLGQYLKTTEILCTVFNEDYTIAQEAQSKVLHIENNSKSSIINIYCLDINNDVSIEHRFDGTLISFCRPQQLAGSKVTEYFRLRISSEKLGEIIKCYNPRNIFLQSAVSIVEAIDFRFNDYRSLPPSLLEVMRNGKSYQIGKVHFLLILESDVDLQFSSVCPVARELEHGIWKKYYDKLGNKNVVAYHWKFKSDSKDKLIENCIMFVKTKVYKCNWQTIIIYLVVAGILAILFNLLSQLLI